MERNKKEMKDEPIIVDIPDLSQIPKPTVKVIAEIGVNYDTIDDLLAHSALQYIVNAKAAGADYVKFQLFNEETIKDSPLQDRLKAYILTEEGVKHLREEADRVGIGFILTPMYLEAVDIAAKYADLIKIRCKDHENEPLIQKAYATRKQLLISVPMRPLNEYDPNKKWLYCLPKYPPEPEDFTLEAATPCDGVSLHYPHTTFDLAWVINRFNGVGYVEKHVMNNNNRVLTGHVEYEGIAGNSYEITHPIDENVSITFHELQNFISQIKLLERMKRFRL